MAWSVDPNAALPPSRQLVDAVLDAIARGELETGSQLPSVRAMAAEVLVNHNTVTRAYLELERMDAVVGRSGRGVFVTAEGPRVARAARHAATLAAFRRAASEALRAGHETRTLQAVLHEETGTRETA
jgi:GntR family transcriptional regulator